MNPAEVVALPDDGMVALHVHRSFLEPVMNIPGADAFIRFKSQEGFKNFMVAAVEAAAMVWPEIAEEWHREEVGS